MSVTISDLRERPEFFDVVADRIWRAWWEVQGVPLAVFTERVRESLGDGVVPTAFVAHDGETFLGTASLIAHDLDERPQLSPWIAAVWTEPDSRGLGIARAMIHHAVAVATTSGYEPVYLCARPAMHSYYVALGWSLIESDVGPKSLGVFSRSR